MIQADHNFSNNVKRVDDLGAIYDEVIRLAPLLTDQASQILRAQFVLIVSAFDTYIHDVVRIGIIQQYEGVRSPAKGLSRLAISYTNMIDFNSQPPLMKIPTLDRIIRNTNAADSYQSSTNVEYALGLIGISKIWSTASLTIGGNGDDVKKRLDLIVRRRNQIAHESDFNPATGNQYPIDRAQVSQTITFIKDLVNAIKSLL